MHARSGLGDCPLSASNVIGLTITSVAREPERRAIATATKR